MTEPLKIVDVIPEEVGKPGDLGSDSRLYSVPIRLARRAADHEADVITTTWNEFCQRMRRTAVRLRSASLATLSGAIGPRSTR